MSSGGAARAPMRRPLQSNQWLCRRFVQRVATAEQTRYEVRVIRSPFGPITYSMLIECGALSANPNLA